MNDRTVKLKITAHLQCSALNLDLKDELGASILMNQSNYVQDLAALLLLIIHLETEQPYCNCVVPHQEKHLSEASLATITD